MHWFFWFLSIVSFFVAWTLSPEPKLNKFFLFNVRKLDNTFVNNFFHFWSTFANYPFWSIEVLVFFDLDFIPLSKLNLRLLWVITWKIRTIDFFTTFIRGAFLRALSFSWNSLDFLSDLTLSKIWRLVFLNINLYAVVWNFVTI